MEKANKRVKNERSCLHYIEVLVSLPLSVLLSRARIPQATRAPWGSEDLNGDNKDWSAMMISGRDVKLCVVVLVINCMAFGCLLAAEKTQKGGIVRVTQGPADLVLPRAGDGLGDADEFRYGIGHVFQAGPNQAGLLCNLRFEGLPAGDFEAGMDVVIFDDTQKISSANAVPVTRTVKYADRVNGQWRIVLKHLAVGGFIPFGARRADGSPHPHAGTGFGVTQSMDFPMKGLGPSYGYYSKLDKKKGMVRTTEVQQFTFDGKEFKVPRVDTYTQAKPLRAPDSKWKLTAPPLRMGIPDGDDLLAGVVATSNDASVLSSDPEAVGVSRWRRVDGRWQPVEFTPVVALTTSLWAGEPSLIRDLDGALLFTARLGGTKYKVYSPENHVVRVWRSVDGRAWKLIVEQPDMRGQSPVTINRAADGTPYIVSNALGRERDKLVLWPLSRDRTGFEEPVTVRDALQQFGRPPSNIVWFMDHTNAGVVRLADGRWHDLLVYRIMDRGEHGGQAPPPQTGLYVEEVLSTGRAIPAWRFTK